MSRRSIRILVAALVAIVAGPAIAHSPALAASTVRPTGIVHDSAGHPLKDVQVTLYRVGLESDIAQTRTNGAGRYTFPAVPKSTKTKYYLAAEDPSARHVPVYHSRTFTAASAKAPSITMSLAGFITGKVSTKDGDDVQPAKGILVTAVNPTNGAAESAAVAADGTFRIGGLSPGSYELTFDDFDANFAGACYDNVPQGDQTCAGTTKVTVRAGKVTTINRQVLDNPLEQASGTVTDANGAPLADVWINVWDADDSTRWYGSTYTDANGDWTLRGIDHAGQIKVKAVDEDEEDPHAARWYRNASTFANATPLTLRDGGEIDDILIALPAA